MSGTVQRYRSNLPDHKASKSFRMCDLKGKMPASAAVLSTEEMIGTEQLSEIIETIIYSAYLVGAIPISGMLVGPSGAGKSKVLMQYQSSIGCHVTTDITSMGLQDILAKDVDQKTNFIVIPDFNIVLSHRASTLQLTIGNLLSATSEGTIRIDDGRAVKETKHGPVGILSAMTREMYAMMGKKWIALGFNRRFLPLNYDYGLQTREKIQLSISNGLTTMLHLAEKKIHQPHKTDVKITDECSTRLMMCSNDLANNIGWIPTRAKTKDNQFKPKAIFTGKQLEFSPHIVLRTLARAHALRDGRHSVDDDDIIFCMKVIAFTRFDQPVML